VHIVVRENKLFKLLETLKLRQIRVADDVVEADILEAYLLHSLLEVRIVQDFQGVPINEKHRIAFDFGVARLYKALISGLLSSLIAI
jgi:hypothetical protein